MEPRYIRNVGVLTEAECSLLREKKIFIAGCGGLGGYILDMLLRIGVGEIRCADGDRFEESNLNRQLLSGENNLGLSKALAAEAHAKAVNSSVVIHAEDGFITEENAEEMVKGCDAVLDALDSIQARKILKSACDRLGIPYIYGAVQGWVAQAAISLPGDSLLDILYPGDDTVITDKSILSFTPALCASLQTALCVKLLCGREVFPGRLYYFNLDDFDLEVLDLA